MKSYGVTIQMKPLQQYFHMVLFVLNVVLTLESVDEILLCDHSNEQYVHKELLALQHFSKWNLELLFNLDLSHL